MVKIVTQLLYIKKHIEEAFQRINRSSITKQQLKIYTDFINTKKPKDTGFKFELQSNTS